MLTLQHVRFIILSFRTRIVAAMSESCGSDPFVYTRAVVCGVPASLPPSAVRMEDEAEPISLDKARQQHEEYVKVLKGLVSEVVSIPVNEDYPDCVFVEDPVVVCDNTALITIPGHVTRRGESAALKCVMEKLGLKVVEMREPGLMDGGDVLFTGREFFVGLSTRTNKEGISQLAAAFPAYPVTSIPVREGLHLKSFMSMAGPCTIAIGQSTAAQDAKKIIENSGKFKYSFFEVPDDIGANCLYVNGTIIHVSEKDYPATYRLFKNDDTLTDKKIALSASELNKVDGCFTCCSVLIK